MDHADVIKLLHESETSDVYQRLAVTFGYVRSKSPLATEYLLENTEGVLRPHQCSLGTAACYLLFMLTAALLMTPSI